MVSETSLPAWDHPRRNMDKITKLSLLHRWAERGKKNEHWCQHRLFLGCMYSPEKAFLSLLPEAGGWLSYYLSGFFLRAASACSPWCPLSLTEIRRQEAAEYLSSPTPYYSIFQALLTNASQWSWGWFSVSMCTCSLPGHFPAHICIFFISSLTCKFPESRDKIVPICTLKEPNSKQYHQKTLQLIRLKSWRGIIKWNLAWSQKENNHMIYGCILTLFEWKGCYS